ncbi:MAG: RNA polymerase sigma factor [Candidatus Pacebacteria bacterium]|nr:RNA polymerase sigma factor [Candidatus Paceibacterota bacterium]
MGDHQKAFEEAYNRYSDELFRHSSMRLPDRDRAIELTQECFLKTWEYVQKGNEIDEFRPFLYRTLRNLIIDEYRRKKSRSLEAMIEGSEETDVETLMPADESNTLEAAIDRFEGKRALKALQALPDLYREVLVLRYVESLSPKEIAQYVGETENAVSVRLHRGLKKLKSLLEEAPQLQS